MIGLFLFVTLIVDHIDQVFGELSVQHFLLAFTRLLLFVKALLCGKFFRACFRRSTPALLGAEIGQVRGAGIVRDVQRLVDFQRLYQVGGLAGHLIGCNIVICSCPLLNQNSAFVVFHGDDSG